MDLPTGGVTAQDRVTVRDRVTAQDRAFIEKLATAEANALQREYERLVEAGLPVDSLATLLGWNVDEVWEDRDPYEDGDVGEEERFREDERFSEDGCFREDERLTYGARDSSANGASEPFADASLTTPGKPEARSHRSLSYAFAQLDRIVTDLEQVERELAGLHARRIDLLAAAEVWAENAAVTGAVFGESLSERQEFAHRAIVAEIAAAMHQSERTAIGQLTDAHQISRLAGTREALRDGRISLTHARIIAGSCASVPAAHRPALEAALLPIAVLKTPAILGRKARSVREQLHPEPIEGRHAKARLTRHVSFEPDVDGMAWLHQYGPASDMLREYETLTTMATGMISCGDTRTLNQLRNDLLTDLVLVGSIEDKLDRIVPCGVGATEQGTRKLRKRARRSARPRVLVTVPVLTLLGKSDEPAILQGYGPIDADTARKLAAEAPSFQRLLTHPISGAVLELDRTAYRPPADLRRWVQARDGTCRAPCCNKSAVGADLDHTIDWARDGTTAGRNLASFCRRDHVKKHKLGWRVRQDDHGVLTWTSPTGREYTTEPEMLYVTPSARPKAPRTHAANGEKPVPF